MSLNVSTSSVGASSATSQVTGAQSSDSAKKSATDSSFKDEMEKVTTKEEKNETSKNVEAKSQETKTSDKAENDGKITSQDKTKSKEASLQAQDENLKTASLSMIDVNNSLQKDIVMMMNTNGVGDMGFLSEGLLSTIQDTTFGQMFALDYTDNIFVSQSDAEFFINLAQNNDVSAQAVVTQAQMAFENGAELSQVQQNVKISETLLNAINIARENNQPLRIDFDQNVAVILRFGKDGSFAANFIPGDKAVEQYLKNNLDSLKSAFQEKDIPYSDLSYSNRGRKHQNEQQRSQQQ